ncbi:MAG: hypothetical protein OEY64_06355 [Nitrospinota bacterium]|nr:hypothetical protein [Nitrospinota bacterium]
MEKRDINKKDQVCLGDYCTTKDGFVEGVGLSALTALFALPIFYYTLIG